MSLADCMKFVETEIENPGVEGLTEHGVNYTRTHATLTFNVIKEFPSVLSEDSTIAEEEARKKIRVAIEKQMAQQIANFVDSHDVQSLLTWT